MKINLGCGRTVLEGWYNVDVVRSPLAKREPELLCDIKKLPLKDACADEVMAIHVFEHFYPWEAEDLLVEWRRLLKVRGTLILEMPDLFKCCRNILEGKENTKPGQLGMWGLFGDLTHKDPLMMHKWGWTFATIKPFLEARGFIEVQEDITQFHYSGKIVRDFRVTARKSG